MFYIPNVHNTPEIWLYSLICLSTQLKIVFYMQNGSANSEERKLKQ